MARKHMHMSQERLAEQIGVTFQQLQKYEKGMSRISAGRLHRVAVTLDLPLCFFLPEVEPGGGPKATKASSELSYAIEFLSSPEGLELNLVFSQIKDVQLRRRVLDLVRSLAEGAR